MSKLVDAVVLDTMIFPVVARSRPTNILPPIPTPPWTWKAPVVVEVAVVVEFTYAFFVTARDPRVDKPSGAVI